MPGEIWIERLNPETESEACRVLARAFATNPLHIAAFGRARVLPRNEVFFQTGLGVMKGQKLVFRAKTASR